MRVCLYLEAEDLLTPSGFHGAFRNHLKALRLCGAEVTTDPGDEYDLLHLHWFGPRSLLYLRRAKRRGIPVVLSVHSLGRYDLVGGFTGTSAIGPLYEGLLDRIYRSADALLVPSEFAKGELERRGHGPVYVVSNGVDLGRFRFDPRRREEWRERLGLEGFTVYCAGNIFPRKGVLDFIAVARRLPGIQFVWFGRKWGPLAFYPRMEVALRRAPPNVRFPGFVREPEGAYAACDLFFFPTHGENQPLALLEAAALGRPLVLRDIPAFSPLEHGIHCLKAGGIEEFAAHIGALAADGGLRRRLAEGALAFAREHGLEKVGEKLLSLYRRILEARGR